MDDNCAAINFGLLVKCKHVLCFAVFVAAVLGLRPRVSSGTSTKNLLARLTNCALLARAILDGIGDLNLELAVCTDTRMGSAFGVGSGTAATGFVFTRRARAAGLAGFSAVVGLESTRVASLAVSAPLFLAGITASLEILRGWLAIASADSGCTVSHPPKLIAVSSSVLNHGPIAFVVQVAGSKTRTIDPRTAHHGICDAGGAVSARCSARLEINPLAVVALVPPVRSASGPSERAGGDSHVGSASRAHVTLAAGATKLRRSILATGDSTWVTPPRRAGLCKGDNRR